MDTSVIGAWVGTAPGAVSVPVVLETMTEAGEHAGEG